MLSEKNQRGRHTTTTTKLHIMYDDTYLFDTPGMENPYPNISDKHQIQEGFREMVSNRNGCKYRDCLHINEPKCSVKDSMLSNESSERRHSHYVKIFETISQTLSIGYSTPVSMYLSQHIQVHRPWERHKQFQRPLYQSLQSD